MPAIVIVLVGLGQNIALLFAVLWLSRLAYPHERSVSSRRSALVLAGLICLGLVSAVVSIFWIVLLPAAIAGSGWAGGAVAVLVAYPIAALILGAVFAQDRRHAQVEAALRESEERYARLADAAFEGISFCDNDIIFDANARLAEMLGYTQHELLGMPTEQLVAPESREMVRRRVRVGYKAMYEHLALRKDGSVFPVEVRSRAMQYQGRSIRVTVVRDSSERMAAQQALAHSERMFQELVQSINAVVWEADAQTFVFSFVSEPAEKLLGYPAADWLATPTFWPDHIHPDDRERAVDYCVRCTQALIYHEFEYRMIAADGHVVWLRDLVTVVAENGQPVRLRGVMVDITARKHAEDALRASEERYRRIVETAAEGIWVLDQANSTTFVNPTLARWLGYTVDEMLGQSVFSFLEADEQARVAAQLERRWQGIDEQYDLRLCRKDGAALWALVSVRAIADEQGGYAGALAMLTDITERKRIEQQYLQAQKMDAVGRLAGGVAHDFNNLLTVILGSSQLLLDELGPEHPLCPDLVPIQDAASRAAALTRQLLAFSRQQVLQPEIVDLNTIVASMEQLLRRLIGEHIALIGHLAEQLGSVRADPSQIEQVLLNLAVNARDAMPSGGTLIIETAEVVIEPSSVHELGEISSGRYVLLTVSDTGAGMDADTQARIFEPFFTTKAPGKGTGLGLATVYGIVRQSGGYIWVYSEVGYGTTFKIYLPQVSVPVGAIQPLPDLTLAPQDSGTLLLVEDEALVRALASRILRARGYQVLEADDGVAALRIAAEHQGAIDLLLTDVIMPGGLSGPQLAECLLGTQPALRVLYMSGYADGMLAHHATFDTRQNLLQKPFTSVELAHAVWNVRRTTNDERRTTNDERRTTN